MIGLVEVITLLLGLSGFGLTANPKPATADAALYYAIPEADVVVHLDVASIVPGNYKNLLALPNQPQIKASPDLTREANEAPFFLGIVKQDTRLLMLLNIKRLVLSRDAVTVEPWLERARIQKAEGAES